MSMKEHVCTRQQGRVGTCLAQSIEAGDLVSLQRLHSDTCFLLWRVDCGERGAGHGEEGMCPERLRGG
jgi:hypothetical protein